MHRVGNQEGRLVEADQRELDVGLSASDWSAGERQLLALARALTVQSPILILDEATSR